jgi:hypothetical protein
VDEEPTEPIKPLDMIHGNLFEKSIAEQLPACMHIHTSYRPKKSDLFD